MPPNQVADRQFRDQKMRCSCRGFRADAQARLIPSQWSLNYRENALQRCIRQQRRLRCNRTPAVCDGQAIGIKPVFYSTALQVYPLTSIACSRFGVCSAVELRILFKGDVLHSTGHMQRAFNGTHIQRHTHKKSRSSSGFFVFLRCPMSRTTPVTHSRTGLVTCDSHFQVTSAGFKIEIAVFRATLTRMQCDRTVLIVSDVGTLAIRAARWYPVVKRQNIGF